MNRETRGNKDGKAQDHDQGIRERSVWWSSLRVWGWWVLTIISHGVEISIAGGVVERVRAIFAYLPYTTYISCEQLLVQRSVMMYLVL